MWRFGTQKITQHRQILDKVFRLTFTLFLRHSFIIGVVLSSCRASLRISNRSSESWKSVTFIQLAKLVEMFVRGIALLSLCCSSAFAYLYGSGSCTSDANCTDFFDSCILNECRTLVKYFFRRCSAKIAFLTLAPRKSCSLLDLVLCLHYSQFAWL